MKYNFTPLLTLFSAALIGGMGLSLASDTKQADSASVATQTKSPESISGKYCVSAGPAVQVLGAKPLDDGSLQFGLSVWFESGQHCGLTGTAKPNAAGGWRFEENINSENEEERCGLDIKSANGEIIVNADENAACRSACGGGAAISNITFPEKSQENKRAVSGLFDPETLYNTVCAAPQP